MFKASPTSKGIVSGELNGEGPDFTERFFILKLYPYLRRVSQVILLGPLMLTAQKQYRI